MTGQDEGCAPEPFADPADSAPTPPVDSRRALLNNLREAAGVWNDPLADDGGRKGAIIALGAIHRYLVKTGISDRLLVPIIGVMSALRDIERGARPPLLTRARSRGRPKSTTGSDILRLQAAAAMQLFMDTGLDRERAARRVARAIRRWPDATINGAKWGTVADWRDEMTSAKAEPALIAVYEQILAGSRASGLSPEHAAGALLRDPESFPF